MENKKLIVLFSISLILIMGIFLIKDFVFKDKIPLGDRFIANISITIYDNNSIIYSDTYLINTTTHQDYSFPETADIFCYPDEYPIKFGYGNMNLSRYGLYDVLIETKPLMFPTLDGETPCFEGYYTQHSVIVIEPNENITHFNLTEINSTLYTKDYYENAK